MARPLPKPAEGSRTRPGPQTTDQTLAAFARLSSESPSLTSFMAERGISLPDGPDHPATEMDESPQNSHLEPVRADSPVSTLPFAGPDAPEPGSGNPVGTVSSRADRQRAKSEYELVFLQRIEGIGKPNRNVNLTDRSHNIIAFLAKYAQTRALRVTMQEVLENILYQHFLQHETELKQMRKEYLKYEEQLSGI